MKKLFQAGLGQFLGGAAAPQHLQTSRPCFRASLRQNFGQFNIHQTVSISVKTFFFFFFGGRLNLDRNADHFPGKIQCHFSGKSLVLPQSF